jgi:hypothetical protein
MRRSLFSLLIAIVVASSTAAIGYAQAATPENRYKAQEISDSDGTPVLLIHLPEYEKVVQKAVFARDAAGVKKALGERPELDLIDFTGGTEAVTAPYNSGSLLIVEYSTPQAAADDGAKFERAFAGRSDAIYRRIGNYAAIVFDVKDAGAANSLLDQIRYEKDVQWIGEPPQKNKRWGVSIPQMANVLLSSIFLLAGGAVVAIGGGMLLGYLYYRRMIRYRAGMAAFSDAGGITRLNLDGLTPTERLLGE